MVGGDSLEGIAARRPASRPGSGQSSGGGIGPPTPVETSAREIGELLGQAGTSDPVDGAVAVLAARLAAAVATSDPDDLRHLLDRLGSRGKLVTLQQV